jgi:hypothetical protein
MKKGEPIEIGPRLFVLCCFLTVAFTLAVHYCNEAAPSNPDNRNVITECRLEGCEDIWVKESESGRWVWRVKTDGKYVIDCFRTNWENPASAFDIDRVRTARRKQGYTYVSTGEGTWEIPWGLDYDVMEVKWLLPVVSP